MTRTKFSPNRNRVPLPTAPDYSLAVVTHYTADPWHARRMDVVKLCLDTMLSGAHDHELVIWDNGSTPEFRKMLRGFAPDALIESVNVGQHAARFALNRIARGRIICHTDDDILFSPTWLDEQMKVLINYQHVALVSGSPNNHAFGGSISANIEFSQRPGVKRWVGRDLIPQGWEDDFSCSIGYPVDRSIRRNDEILIESNGVKAWAHGHHMQFLAYRDTIDPFLKSDSRYLLEPEDLSERIDAAGWLQLTTFERSARHIGNQIDQEMVDNPWPKLEIDL